MDVKEALGVLQEAVTALPDGARHIVVLDRGWIFAGHLSRDEDTGINTLTHAVNVRKWNKGGFGLLSRSAVQAEATLDACAPILFRDDAMIFSTPIGDDWDAR